MADKKKTDLASKLDRDADQKTNSEPPKGKITVETPADDQIPQEPSEVEIGTASATDSEPEVEGMLSQDAEVPISGPSKAAKRGGFVPALIGGVLAAFFGYFAARTDALDAVLPDMLKSGASDSVAALQDSDAKQAEAISALREEIAGLDQPDLAPIQAQLDGILADIAPLKAGTQALQDRLNALAARLDPLTERLEVLEKRPMTEAVSETAIAAYEREVAALKDAIASQRADVEQMIDEARALESDAAAAAQNADTQATVTRLRVALDGEAAIAPILVELTSVGVIIPETLKAAAIDGVATMAMLSEEFPSAARAALSATRAQDQSTGGLSGFLQRHLGARSVDPRVGNDVDAILSRAEAAVIAGQLSNALDELTVLPEVARVEMQSWMTLASTRLNALRAIDALAQSLNTN